MVDAEYYYTRKNDDTRSGGDLLPIKPFCSGCILCRLGLIRVTGGSEEHRRKKNRKGEDYPKPVLLDI
jgi:hypothetical protein